MAGVRVFTDLMIWQNREFLPKDQFAVLFADGTEIRKMTVSFIQSMVMPRSGVKNIRKVPDWSNQIWEIYERVTGKPRPEMFLKKPPQE
jgi:hypothetical protein